MKLNDYPKRGEYGGIYLWILMSLFLNFDGFCL